MSTRTVTAGGVEFAYRELGANKPGTPVRGASLSSPIVFSGAARPSRPQWARRNLERRAPATCPIVRSDHPNRVAVRSVGIEDEKHCKSRNQLAPTRAPQPPKEYHITALAAFVAVVLCCEKMQSVVRAYVFHADYRRRFIGLCTAETTAV